MKFGHRDRFLRPPPFTHEHVDRREARVPLVRQPLTGLRTVPVGLQQHDVVAQPDQLVDDRPPPETPPVGSVDDPRAESGYDTLK